MSPLVSIDFTADKKLADVATANRILSKALSETEVQVDTLILRHTAVSGSAIMGTRELSSLTNLRVLDFSGTNASLTALDNLPKFSKLERANFNHCPKVILTTNPMGHDNLEVLSLLGCRVFPTCAKHILEKFPKLQALSYTINPYDQKFLGFEPSKQLASVSELSVLIRKIKGVWNAIPLDANYAEIKAGQTLYIDTQTRKLYSTPQDNAAQITARLNPFINLDTDFALRPISFPHQLLDRSIAMQSALAIRQSNSPK